MITFRTITDKGLKVQERAEKRSWIDVVDPGKDELQILEREYGVNPEHLLDIMDLDEQARFEKEDDYTLLIVRLPLLDPRGELPYYTLPCGILLFSDRIITICQQNNEVLDELRMGRARGLDPANKSAFVLHLLGRAAIVYLRYLKDINRRTSAIEKDLQRSVKNNELTQLLSYEKSLVYFTTSLKSNEILLEKIQAARLFRVKEDELELLEDVLTDNKQAIEMANIYSSILTGTMDAFASVISNNLNRVMRRLTIVSIVLMIPTLISSFFGMNVDLPFQNVPLAFLGIFGGSLFASVIGALLLSERRKKKIANLAIPYSSNLIVHR